MYRCRFVFAFVGWTRECTYVKNKKKQTYEIHNTNVLMSTGHVQSVVYEQQMYYWPPTDVSDVCVQYECAIVKDERGKVCKFFPFWFLNVNNNKTPRRNKTRWGRKLCNISFVKTYRACEKYVIRLFSRGNSI